VIAERPIDQRHDQHTTPRPWHATSAARVMALLDTSATGLSAKDAAARLLHDGPNELAPPPSPSTLLLFARQFNSPLIYLLIAAAAINK
jgi:Ca2+-transporting ATPase